MAAANPNIPARFDGVKRVYTQADVERLRGTVRIEYTLARLGANRFWELLYTNPFVPALGALTGENLPAGPTDIRAWVLTCQSSAHDQCST